MIKPDATEKGNTGAILEKINAAGFRIAAMKMIHLSAEKAGEFYAIHRERPFYGELVEFMSPWSYYCSNFGKRKCGGGFQETYWCY
jgi:nucleoside-diphosphate kinase